MQHIVVVIIGGIAGLALFWFGYRMFGLPPARGAALFVGAWLIAALLNGAVGVLRVGLPLINEIGAFIPIFGIPAGVAALLIYWSGR